MPRRGRRVRTEAESQAAAKKGLSSVLPAFQCFAGLKKQAALRTERASRDVFDDEDEPPTGEEVQGATSFKVDDQSGVDEQTVQVDEENQLEDDLREAREWLAAYALKESGGKKDKESDAKKSEGSVKPREDPLTPPFKTADGQQKTSEDELLEARKKLVSFLEEESLCKVDELSTKSGGDLLAALLEKAGGQEAPEAGAPEAAAAADGVDGRSLSPKAVSFSPRPDEEFQADPAEEEPVGILNLDTLQSQTESSSENGCSDSEVDAKDCSTSTLASQRRAVAVLAKAMESSSDPHKIEEACDHAENHGVDDLMVENGRRLAWQLRMASGLQRALQSGNADRIETACKNAKRAGVDAEVVENAHSTLIEYRHHALMVAMSNTDSDCLEQACKDAQKAGAMAPKMFEGVHSGVLEAGWRKVKELRGIGDRELDTGPAEKEEPKETKEWYIGRMHTPASSEGGYTSKTAPDDCSGGSGQVSTGILEELVEHISGNSVDNDAAVEEPESEAVEEPESEAVAEPESQVADSCKVVVSNVEELDLVEAEQLEAKSPAQETGDDPVHDVSATAGAFFWKGGFVADDDAFPAVAEGMFPSPDEGLLLDQSMPDTLLKDEPLEDQNQAGGKLINAGDEPLQSQNQAGGDPIDAVDKGFSVFFWKPGLTDIEDFPESEAEAEAEAEAAGDCGLSPDAVTDTSVEPARQRSKGQEQEQEVEAALPAANFWKSGLAGMEDFSESEAEAEAQVEAKAAEAESEAEAEAEAETKAAVVDASVEEVSPTANFWKVGLCGMEDLEDLSESDGEAETKAAGDCGLSLDAVMDVSVEALTPAHQSGDDAAPDDCRFTSDVVMNESVEVLPAANQKGNDETSEDFSLRPDAAIDVSLDAATTANQGGDDDTSDDSRLTPDVAIDGSVDASPTAVKQSWDDETFDDSEPSSDAAMDASVDASTAGIPTGEFGTSQDFGLTLDTATDAPADASTIINLNENDTSDSGPTPDAAPDAEVDASSAVNRKAEDDNSYDCGLTLDATDASLNASFSSDQDVDDAGGQGGLADDVDWEDPFDLLSGMANIEVSQPAEAEPEAEDVVVTQNQASGFSVYSRGFGALCRVFGVKRNQQFTDSEAPTRSSSCQTMVDTRML